MTTGKTTALTRWTFVREMMSLLSKMLSRFVIAFLSRSVHLNFMGAVTVCNDFGVQKYSMSLCPFSPIYLPSILYFTLTESGFSLGVQIEAAGPLSSQPWVIMNCLL